MQKQIKTALFGIFILCIFLVNHVSAEILVSEAGVEYDSDITKVFDDREFAEESIWHNQTNYQTLKIIDDEVWLKAIVRLKDNSGIEITGTTEEKIKLIKQKEEWFKPKIEEVLATLSEDDIKVSSKHSDGFSGLISKEGFDKLINNKAVRKIGWPKRGAVGLDFSLKNWGWIIITVVLIIIVLLYLIINKSKNNKK